MTIGELIVHLQTFDASLPVVSITCGHCDNEGDVKAGNVYADEWFKTSFGTGDAYDWDQYNGSDYDRCDVLVIR